jgi:hypothetical protein
MDESREVFLADSRFTRDQHGGVDLGDARRLANKVLHRRAAERVRAVIGSRDSRSSGHAGSVRSIHP